MTDNNQEKLFDFETALAELERIVTQMERDSMGIEESITLFEKGVHLVRTCEHNLKKAQQKVTILLEKNGQHLLSPYHAEEVLTS